LSYNETPGNEGSRWWHIGREISLRYESSVIQMGSPPSRAEVRQAEEDGRPMHYDPYPVRLETVIDILASYNSISQGEWLRAQELPEHIRLDERALGDMGIVLMPGLLGPEECEEEGRLCWHVVTHEDDDSSQMGRIVAWELSSGEAFVEFWLGECPDVRMFYETRERIDQDIEYTAAIIVRKLGYKSGLEVAVEATLEELDECLREFHSARSEKGWCWSTDPTTGAPVFTRLALCPGGVVFEGGQVWCVEAPNICSDAGSAAQFCTIGAGPLPGLGDGLSVSCWPDWNKEETPVSYRQYVGELMGEFQRRAIIRDLPAWLTEPEHTEPPAAAGEDTGNLAAEQGQTEPAPPAKDGAGTRIRLTDRTRRKAGLFKSIKHAHPKWDQARVADEATDEVQRQLKDTHPDWSEESIRMEVVDKFGKDIFDAEDVRNAYRTMRRAYPEQAEEWTWKRADRIRDR
jgi:hypothetical protein